MRRDLTPPLPFLNQDGKWNVLKPYICELPRIRCRISGLVGARSSASGLDRKSIHRLRPVASAASEAISPAVPTPAPTASIAGSIPVKVPILTVGWAAESGALDLRRAP